MTRIEKVNGIKGKGPKRETNVAKRKARKGKISRMQAKMISKTNLDIWIIG